MPSCALGGGWVWTPPPEAGPAQTDLQECHSMSPCTRPHATCCRVLGDTWAASSRLRAHRTWPNVCLALSPGSLRHYGLSHVITLLPSQMQPQGAHWLTLNPAVCAPHSQRHPWGRLPLPMQRLDSLLSAPVLGSAGVRAPTCAACSSPGMGQHVTALPPTCTHRRPSSCMAARPCAAPCASPASAAC